jgi:NAD-dependent dihydropyrimidine dehydrogenase PreA subunit
MIEIKDNHLCCGCEACVQACPKHCISFDEDAEGFRYPLVDKAVCIDCGLCEKVCPVLNQAEERKPLEVYAAKNHDEQELLKSSSGGIFILLAKTVIHHGGVVFGAKFDKEWNVIHAYAETEGDVEAFMGSKYVQSRIGNTYKEAKTFLEAGRQVLFSGTSCQIAGLKRFLRKEYDNLLTVDVICHGVPSPKVWRMYLEEIKRNARKGENSVSSPLTHLISERDAHGESIQIKSISFRDKRLGWKKYSFALTLAKASADGKQNTVSLSCIHREDPYMKVFLKNIILRPSCYYCPAKGGKSRSDITIADFWGVEKVLPDFDDNRGVGLIMVNTDKGKDIAECLDIVCQKVSYQEAVMSNPFYFRSVNLHANRAKFFHLIDKNDSIIRLSERMLHPSMKIRVKRFLSKLKRKIL